MPYHKPLFRVLSLLILGAGPLWSAHEVTSPDGLMKVELSLDAEAAPHYRITKAGKPVLEESRLGLVRDDEDFSKRLSLVGEDEPVRVKDDYELPASKRRMNHYRANRKVFHLKSAKGYPLDLVFQVSNDGVAFRYRFPDKSETDHEIVEELSSFRMQAGTKTWLQPMSVAKTGWKGTNPSYEEHYRMGEAAGAPSTLGAGWCFPALFRSGETWLVLSEAGLGRGHCGSRLRHLSPNSEYSIGFPDTRETADGRTVNPRMRLPWESPWRLVVAGGLDTVVESSLGTDLADKPTPETRPPGGPVRPGKASWSWPLLGDGQTTFEVQRRFIDFAAEMGWAYCLIDAQWDTQIGYERMKELADYGRARQVELLVWYNSNGTWNEAPQTPRDCMHTHEARVKEFARLRTMGIRGVKIDFFGGDGQAMIELYQDILRDAAPYGLLVNFHGATLPRGWQRTYPHLMTMESIKGFEFITFEQANADAQPSHAALLPYTRNLFDPMDFTPVCLGPLPRGERRTTQAFELAQAVLFTSGIQHYVETPERLAQVPACARQLLKDIPAMWEETRYVAGEPGKDVVLARLGADGRWYVAGLNGEPVEKTLELDLRRLGKLGEGRLITDQAREGGGTGSVAGESRCEVPAGGRVTVTLRANGGFVLVFTPSH